MRKYLLLILVATSMLTFSSQTISSSAAPTTKKQIELRKNTKGEKITFEKKEDEQLYAIISYKKDKKENIYKIPTSKFEDAEKMIEIYGMPEEYSFSSDIKFTLKYDLDSMYDKNKNYMVPSSVLNEFLEYLDENYEKVENMNEISKEEFAVNVKNNSYFFELGLKERYMTKYEDVDLEKAEPVIEYLKNCEENDECKIKYISVIHGARYEKIYNISKEDLLKIIPMLYDKTKIKPIPEKTIDPEQKALPASEVARG